MTLTAAMFTSAAFSLVFPRRTIITIEQFELDTPIKAILRRIVINEITTTYDVSVRCIGLG